MALRIAQSIVKGIRPSGRRPGLRDPILPGELGADRFAPGYTLVINRETMPDEVIQHITSIDYEDNEELYDQMTIRLEGFFEDKELGQDIPIPEWVQKSTLFSEGNIVWVYMGYGTGGQELIGGAEIVRREFDYGDNPSCQIICYEPLHRMANEFAEKAITYKGMRSSDIVKKIARKSTYSGEIGALFNVEFIERLPVFTPKAEVQKRGESDFAFLKRMADVRGWHLYTKFDTKKNKFNLFYGPDVDKQQETFRYEYRPKGNLLPEDQLLSFKPTINTIDQNTEVDITTIDEKRKKGVKSSQKYQGFADGKLITKRKFSGDNTDFKNKELQNPTRYRFEIFGVSKKIIANRPFKDEQEVKKFIINWARETIKNFIVGNGRVAGNERLQSRSAHIFMGLGDTFSGTETKPAKWYLTKVKHKIDSSGYSTTFDARKVIDWIPNDDIRATVPATQAERERSKKAGRITSIVQSGLGG